jgi:ankyrin repeat protein
MQVVSILAAAHGCDLNARDHGARTSLHYAAALGHVDVVNELWCRGAKIEPVDASGWTGCHICSLSH